MKSDPRPSCEDCVHWQEHTESADVVRWGNCHRYPPSVVVVDDDPDCVQAWTVLPFGCGEHIHKVQ